MLNFDNAVDYHYGKFPPTVIDYQKITPALVNATSAISRYDQMLKQIHNSEILLAPLRNQEAVMSSRIEGTISTMDEIMKFAADEESEEIVNPNNFRDDVIETILYERALKNAQKALNEGYKLNPTIVRNIHQQLLYWGRGAKKNPGRYKAEQNFVGSYKGNEKVISYIPIKPEKLEEGLDHLFSYINESDHITLLKVAIMHLEFEALHPFEDGNGRIGRMLITLLLWSEKLISQPHFYISGYFEEHKEEYIQSMRDVSKYNSWDNWLLFFLKAVEVQANKNLEIAEKIQHLYEDMKSVFSEKLSSRWCISALDYIFTYPVFRNNKFTSKSGIPKATAQRFTRILEKENIIKLVQEASGRKPALYSFEPLMTLVRV
jgi:Fic family protein